MDAKDEHQTEESTRRVIVTDFDMSFTSMVWFMVKWVLASIPALIMLATMAFVAAIVIRPIVNGERRSPPSFSSDAHSSSAATAINEAESLLASNKAAEAYGKANAALATMTMSAKQKARLHALQQDAFERMKSSR